MSEIINNGVPMNAPSNDISGYTYDTPPTYASLQDQINELDNNLTKIGTVEKLIERSVGGNLEVPDITKYSELYFVLGHATDNVAYGSRGIPVDIYKNGLTWCIEGLLIGSTYGTDRSIRTTYIDDTHISIENRLPEFLRIDVYGVY